MEVMMRVVRMMMIVVREMRLIMQVTMMVVRVLRLMRVTRAMTGYRCSRSMWMRSSWPK